MTFSTALNLVKKKEKVAREGWNGKNQWVEVCELDKISDVYAPFLILKNAQDVYVPWVPSQGDLFANDWAVVE
jgi:hypothetical protein